MGGSYYLQTLTLTPTALLAAALVGVHAAAVITRTTIATSTATPERQEHLGRALGQAGDAAALRRRNAAALRRPRRPAPGPAGGLPCRFWRSPGAQGWSADFIAKPQAGVQRHPGGNGGLQLGFALLLAGAFVL